ncbi:MAG: acyltransferase family protein, partial [Actinobacteria bacterium]|nr:acyltransferase family protein [Actinomycetota bacterium]
MVASASFERLDVDGARSRGADHYRGVLRGPSFALADGTRRDHLRCSCTGSLDADAVVSLTEASLMTDVNQGAVNDVADANPYRARIAYQPALDGVRAIAVTMVLLFHGGVSWMNGGYFGVSVFFTLSGFLITSLLCSEFSSTHRVAPGAFYVRRAKRLLPASIVCLSVVSIMASANAWTAANHVRRDLLGSLAQVANWVRLL